MTAAVWSTPPDKCSLDFPARTLIRFMHNHHLLQLTGKPSWLTIPGGSHVYVKKVLEKIPPTQQHYSMPVTSVQTLLPTDSTGAGVDGLVTIGFAGGKQQVFDAVIMATHSDTTLNILGDSATEDERRILAAFSWNQNEAVLHCDPKVRPGPLLRCVVL